MSVGAFTVQMGLDHASGHSITVSIYCHFLIQLGVTKHLEDQTQLSEELFSLDYPKEYYILETEASGVLGLFFILGSSGGPEKDGELS